MELESLSSSSSSSCLSQISPRVSQKRKAGRKKFKETRHPIYRGVRQRNGKKWVCEVREPNKKTRIWVGTFPRPEMAARAHDVAALALQGNMAVLNFLDSAWVVPRAKSSSPKDIRVAASILLIRDESREKVLEPSLLNVHCVDESKQKVLKKALSSLDVLCADESSEEVVDQPRSTYFLDEEALFNMPGLLHSMAEGLILTPPAMRTGFDWDDLAGNAHFTTLWD